VTVTYKWPQDNWLQRETPLDIPIFTPFHVRPWTENCLFAIDAQIVRMVYIGGLSTNDPTALVWTLYGPAPSERRGVEVRHAWLTSRERFPIALIGAADRARLPGDAEQASQSYREELELIENISGLSRRQLTDWLQTSHTTLNSIARSERTPRASLAARIAALSQLMRRLASLYGSDPKTMRQALTTRSFDDRSALDYVLSGDYDNAATAAQFALKPPKKLMKIKGQRFPDSPTVAVEDL
jgi:hypothetical protein